MQTRFLGPERLAVSAIGFGAPTFKGAEPPGGIGNACRVIDRAIERGVTYIDTADHGSGNNEGVLGAALAGKRDKVVLASKFGNLRGVDWGKGWGKAGRSADGSPEYARFSVEGSLKRLKTDYLDLYYLHRVDPEIPIEETIGGMARLKEEGKILHLAISEAGPATLARASAEHPITAVESEYSLMTREYEGDTLPAARTLGIGFVAYYPLARGFFTGAMTAPPTDGRAAVPRFSAENLPRNLELLADFARIATEKGCTTGQLALAWLLHKGEDIVPIPGTNSLGHLDENIGAADIVLSEEDMVRIEAIFDPARIAGERFDRDRSDELNI